MPRLIYFVPIRKGSKGIPNKNMKILGDKPLVAWVLDAIIASKTAHEIWVATDDDRAEEYIAEHFPIVNIFRRSEQSATDESNVIDVVMEFIEKCKLDSSSMFILAQATSPFTCPSDFTDLVTIISDNKEYDSFISCKRVNKFIWHEDGYPLSYDLDSKPRRQDYNGVLIESGAFYASSIGQIQKTKQLISGRIFVIESSSPTYIDIDTSVDWITAEAIINNYNNKTNEQPKV